MLWDARRVENAKRMVLFTSSALFPAACAIFAKYRHKKGLLDALPITLIGKEGIEGIAAIGALFPRKKLV